MSKAERNEFSVLGNFKFAFQVWVFTPRIDNGKTAVLVSFYSLFLIFTPVILCIHSQLHLPGRDDQRQTITWHELKLSNYSSSVNPLQTAGLSPTPVS